MPQVRGQWMSLQRGETAAAIAALKIVLRLLDKGMLPLGTLRRVILKTDSEGLTRSVTDWYVPTFLTYLLPTPFYGSAILWDIL